MKGFLYSLSVKMYTFSGNFMSDKHLFTWKCKIIFVAYFIYIRSLFVLLVMVYPLLPSSLPASLFRLFFSVIIISVIFIVVVVLFLRLRENGANLELSISEKSVSFPRQHREFSCFLPPLCREQQVRETVKFTVPSLIRIQARMQAI